MNGLSDHKEPENIKYNIIKYVGGGGGGGGGGRGRGVRFTTATQRTRKNKVQYNKIREAF